MFKPCVLIRWDFNFCVRSSPLRGTATGKVFVQDIYSKIRKIEKLSDLQQLPCDATSLATSAPAGAAVAQRSHGTMNRPGPRRKVEKNL